MFIEFNKLSLISYTILHFLSISLTLFTISSIFTCRFLFILLEIFSENLNNLILNKPVNKIGTIRNIISIVLICQQLVVAFL